MKLRFLDRLKGLRTFSHFGVCCALFGVFGSNLVTQARATESSVSTVMTDYRNEILSLFTTIENYYGPLELKKQTVGLDWENLKKQALLQADNIHTSNDFYMLVADILNSFNDAHTGVKLPSTLEWSLPFQMSVVEGDVLINFYDISALKKANCPMQIGDEVKTFNGQSIKALYATQPVFSKNGNDITNRMMFVRTLSKLQEFRGIRMSALGPKVALGLVNSKGQAYTCNFVYEETGLGLINRNEKEFKQNMIIPGMDRLTFDDDLNRVLKLDHLPVSSLTEKDRAKMFKLTQIIQNVHKLINLQTNIGDDAKPAETKPAESEPKVTTAGRKISIGDQEPYFKLPDNFKRIDFPSVANLLNEKDFYAGVFEYKGKKVGFLRIPSYVPSVVPTLALGLNYVISVLKKNSDYLILDQTNNPGGMVPYSDMIIKSFVGAYDASKHMKFIVKPTQRFLRSYAELLSTIDSDSEGALPPEALELVKDIKADYERIHKAFVHHQSLSEPISLLTFSKIVEMSLYSLYNTIPIKDQLVALIGEDIFTPQVYEAPVYMLINELDYSGGDATPAGLQDYGRVKLIGVRTAGAGGSVEEFRNTQTSDYEYRLTVSLMYRKNGKYVENYGVQPDYKFDLTKADYKNGFSQVLPNIMKIVEKIQYQR